uniref:Neurotransmitter-gated ion-channel transmembrane domain-containing protein n=1 Tax=Strigamia maritima TaxID=126957 RepID=T1J7X0_STRMM
MLNSSQHFFIIFLNFIWIKSSYANEPRNEDLDNKTVVFQLEPLTIVSISPKTMDFTVEFKVFTTWRYSDFNQSLSSPKSHMIAFGFCKIKNNYVDESYPPDLYFKNCKQCNDGLLTGADVYYNSINHIFIALPSNALSNREIKFDFFKNLALKNINTPPDYYLVKVSTSVCTQNMTLPTECISFDFHLRHLILRDMSLVFLPSLLIVIISWISFWLDVSAIAPRISLGLTSLLTLITHFNNAQKNLPSVSILMALDVWMCVCIMSVFASMIEYAIVYRKCCKLKKKVKTSTKIKSIPNSEAKCLMLWKRIFNGTSNPTFLDELSQICPLTPIELYEDVL